MDRNQKLSAWDVVNRYPEKELEKILREFGEERLSRKIAKAIAQKRERKTDRDLFRIIKDCGKSI